MAVDASQVEVKATLPPPNLYNRAVLEAFQGALSKNEVIQSCPDLVVFLAGSFSKGLGHYFSDSDNFALTDSNHVSEDLFRHSLDSIEPEFRALVSSDPKFAPLRRYTILGDIIQERYDAKDKKLAKSNSMLWTQTYGKRFGRRGAVLQRAYNNLNVKAPEQEGETARIGDTMLTDDERISNTITSICSAISNFDTSKQHEPTDFHNLILILASEIGINAYEVTPGKLYEYQKRIIQTISQLRETDGKRYQEFMKVMQDNYLNYTRSENFDFERTALHPKSPLLKRAIEKTEAGEPLLEFYRKFQQFPTVEQLGTHFKIQG